MRSNVGVMRGGRKITLRKDDTIKYRATKQGMKRGQWKIVDNSGKTIKSGISSKRAVIDITKKMNKQGTWNYVLWNVIKFSILI